MANTTLIEDAVPWHTTKYAQSGAPVLWSFVKLVGLLRLEAPRKRRRRIIQRRRIDCFKP